MDKRLSAKILLPLQICVYGYNSLSDLQETRTKKGEKRQSNDRHKLGPKESSSIALENQMSVKNMVSMKYSIET